MNNENLIHFGERTESERRELARKAGRASGAARREKKKLREVMEIALSMKEQNPNVRKMMKDAGWNDDDIDQQAVITQGLMTKAKRGDVFAYNAIRDIVGEKPVERHEVDEFQDGIVQIEFVGKGKSKKLAHSEDEVDTERRR